MQKADLHIHTTASDGLLSPQQVVKWANKKRLGAIAITDHDTISGIDEAIEESKKYPTLEVIPGIELSCEYNSTEVHILGYFIDHNSSQLKNITDELKTSRLTRGQKIVEKLNQLDINISVQEVKEIAKEGFIGRPHIARVLISKKYVNSMEEAFDKYIGRDKPAYVNRYKLSVIDSIKIIHSAGGVAVLAHPSLIDNKDIIPGIIRSNIDGIEVIHSKHSSNDILEFYKLADKYNLIKTAGSDCHGILINSQPMLGDFSIEYKQVEKLKNKAEIYR